MARWQLMINRSGEGKKLQGGMRILEMGDRVCGLFQRFLATEICMKMEWWKNLM